MAACQPMTVLETSKSQASLQEGGNLVVPAPTPAQPSTPAAASVPSRGSGGRTGRLTGSCTGGRAYTLYVPSSYKDQVAMPLVAAMHGLGDEYRNFDEINRAAGWHQLAEERGFIFMVPAPVNSARQSFLSFNPNGSGDLAAVKVQMDTLLECIYRDVGARYNIETTRIDWIGFSEGAAFVNVAASLLSGKLHGVGIYAGGAPRLATEITRRMPLYFVVGTTDSAYNSVVPRSQDWSSHPTKLSTVNAGHSFLALNSLVAPSVVYDWISQNATEPVVSGF